MIATRETENTSTDSRAELTLSKRCKLAISNRDYIEALSLANIYGNRESAYFCENDAIWLLRIFLNDKPIDLELSGLIDLDEFLSNFSHIDNPDKLFDDRTHLELLEALKRNNTITELSFDSEDSFNSVNTNIAVFIAESKTLKSLDISYRSWNTKTLQNRHMDFIAYGLRFNTSLEKLNFCEQPIGDEGLFILLDALDENPNTKLKSLNLYGTRLTEHGAKRLIEFLQTNKSLESINLKGNRAITQYVKEIELLTEKNKAAREMSESERIADPECAAPSPAPMQVTFSAATRESFLANLGKRLNVGKNLLSRSDIDWLSLFENAINPYAHVRFLMLDFNKYSSDKVRFILLLEHASPLNISDDGNLFNAFCFGKKNVNFSVGKKCDSTGYYLNDKSSLLNIHIENIAVKNQEQLDKKLKDEFEVIKSVISELFTKGIYISSARDVHSWLDDKEEAFKYLSQTAKCLNAPYLVDAACFPQPDQSADLKM